MNRAILSLVLASTALSGCVTPPRLGTPPAPKPAASYATGASFAAPDAPWPADRWWTSYGDAQLDALIDEGLRNAPTMAQAAARLRRAEALIGAANASALPSISADGSLTVSKPSTEDGIPVLPVRQGYHDYGRATLGFSWELDFWGKNRAAIAAPMPPPRAYSSRRRSPPPMPTSRASTPIATCSPTPSRCAKRPSRWSGSGSSMASIPTRTSRRQKPGRPPPGPISPRPMRRSG
jgi:hypothetical protein